MSQRNEQRAMPSGSAHSAPKTFSIVLLDKSTPQRLEQLRALLPAGFTLTSATVDSEAHRIALVREADFAITGQVEVSAAVLEAAKHLKLLHKWGVGVDNIDLDTARKRGIRVARTTGSNALPVAEFTIGLMLSALRCLSYGHHQLKQGHWQGPGLVPNQTMLLSGKTVGIVGLGAIGTEVAKLLRGFGCRILYAKRQPLGADEEARLGVHHVPLQTLLREADVVSLHCPLTAETSGLIDNTALGSMKSTAVLVNVARGGVVVESDLYEALRNRVILAAAMDVFSIEPLPADSPLLTLDNLVVTPHLAAVTADTFEPTVRRMFETIRLVSTGQDIPERDAVV